MAQDEELAEVFAIPDFWKTSALLKPVTQDEPFFSLDISREPGQLVGRSEATVAGEGFFRRPTTLDNLTSGDPPREESSVLDDVLTHQEDDTASMLDVWLTAIKPPAEDPKYRSWNATNGTDQTLSAPTFISEAGPRAFDGFLDVRHSPPSAGGTRASNTGDVREYCAALVALTLGRESVLFTWNAEKRSFTEVVASFKLVGISAAVLHGVTKVCLESGISTRFLRSFVETAYTTATAPSRIALANVVDTLLLAVQKELGSHERKVRSVLKLQAIIKPIHSVLSYFKSLVLKLAHSKSDEELLSVMYEEAQAAEYREPRLRDITREVLRAVSKPWMNFVEEWLGLKKEEGIVLSRDGPGRSFVKVGKQMWVDQLNVELEEPDYFLDEARMPGFMPSNLAQALFETGRNLRFLRSHHPDHRLSHQIHGLDPPSLEWQFTWEDASKLEEKAKAYGLALSQALQNPSSHNLQGSQKKVDGFAGYTLQWLGQDEAHIQEHLLASMNKLDHLELSEQPESLEGTIHNHLLQEYTNTESPAAFDPHWSLLPLLSFEPVITAQSRVVSSACMKLLFSSHDLVDHVKLLGQFSLMGSGVFCSRLSHALFDPEQDTAERQAGVAITGRSMGLRLLGRENWPPASSELRLALMGVLSESYYEQSSAGRSAGRPSTVSKPELPGDLSFAVRDLSPEEVEKCLNPDSVEALDFLRLSYKPPSALYAVISPVILAKYDNIFKQLLRILRVQYVTSRLHLALPPETLQQRRSGDIALRFCAESHHFASQLMAYFFGTCIGTPWDRFYSWLSDVQAEVNAEMPNSAGGARHSPDRVREYHEQILDEMMFGLFLRKRQKPLLKMLEDIFALILQFAQWTRRRGEEEDKQQAPLRDIYNKFRNKIGVFVTVCKGLSEKDGYRGRNKEGQDVGKGRGRRDEEEGANTIDRLVLMLDISEYYGRKHG